MSLRQVEDLLEAQVERLRAMERLSRAIGDGADREEEPEAIMVLLAERQARLADLAEAASVIESAREGVVGGIEPAAEARLDRLAAAAGAIIERVRESDDRARRAMERRRESMTRELAELGKAQRAVNAYGAGGPAPARFEDRQG